MINFKVNKLKLGIFLIIFTVLDFYILDYYTFTNIFFQGFLVVICVLSFFFGIVLIPVGLHEILKKVNFKIFKGFSIQGKFIIPTLYLSIFLTITILFKKARKPLKYTEYERIDMFDHNNHVINFYNENQLLSIFLFILFTIFIYFLISFFYPIIFNLLKDKYSSNGELIDDVSDSNK